MKACMLIIIMILYFGILYSEEACVRYIELDDIILYDYVITYVERQDNHKVIAILIPCKTRLEFIQNGLLINTYHPDALEFDECFYLDLRKYEIKDEFRMMPGINVDFEIYPYDRYITNNGKKIKVFNTKKGIFLVPYYFCDNLVFYDRNIYHENSILEKVRPDNPKE